MGQLHTWFSILALQRLIPATGATILAFIVFWIAHSLRAETRPRPALASIRSTPRLTAVGDFPARPDRGALNARYLDRGSLLRRPRFGRRGYGLARSGLRQSALFLSVQDSVLFGPVGPVARHRGAGRFDLLDRRPRLGTQAGTRRRLEERAGNQPQPLGLAGALNSSFLRGIGRRVFARHGRCDFFLGRYSLLLYEHGSFMVGSRLCGSEHRPSPAVGRKSSAA